MARVLRTRLEWNIWRLSSQLCLLWWPSLLSPSPIILHQNAHNHPSQAQMKQLTTLIAVLLIDCSDHCFTSSFFHHNIVKGITIKLGACYLHPGDHHRLHWEPPRCPRRHLRQDHEEHHKHPHLQPCGDEDCDCDQIWFNPKTFRCRTCCSLSSVFPSLQQTTLSPLSGLLETYGAAWWVSSYLISLTNTLQLMFLWCANKVWPTLDSSN